MSRIPGRQTSRTRRAVAASVYSLLLTVASSRGLHAPALPLVALGLLIAVVAYALLAAR